MDIVLLIAQALMFIFPAYCANGTPVLAGGGANIHQVPIVLQSLTKIKTEVGQPLIRLKNYDPKYAASIGLAMKEITYG